MPDFPRRPRQTISVLVVDPNGKVETHPAIVLTDGVDVSVRFEAVIPTNFASLIKAEVILVPEGTGNLRRSVSTLFGKVGAENYDTHTDSIVAGEVAVTLNKIESIDILAAFTGVKADDLIGIEFTRHGSHANDTVDADCKIIGFRLEYQNS